MGSHRSTREELRFGFGANWQSYEKLVDESRIRSAEAALVEWYGSTLLGRSFLDVGCGSGLSSLAANRLGARVTSFDYDPDSVAATTALKNRFATGDDHWTIEQGSVLDRDYLERLGSFDCVYSWGVLHHTGDMWTALGNIRSLVKPEGLLWIAIYDDQGNKSRRWLAVKKAYNRSSRPVRAVILALSAIRLWVPTAARALVHGDLLALWRSPGRGMDPWHDLVDWVGGYPFEVAKIDELYQFFAESGFKLERMRTGSNNELLLRAPEHLPESFP